MLSTLTVVTHGRVTGEGYVNWVDDVANAIVAESDPQNGPHYALPYHWEERSFGNNLDIGDLGDANSDEVAGELYAQVVEQINQSNDKLNIHLIGFSRGAYVVAEKFQHLVLE